MSRPEPPNRRCVLTLEIGGDNYEEITFALRQVLIDLNRGCHDSMSCSPSVSWQHKYTETEHPTHEEYHELNDAFLRDLRTWEELQQAERGRDGEG